MEVKIEPPDQSSPVRLRCRRDARRRELRIHKRINRRPGLWFGERLQRPPIRVHFPREIRARIVRAVRTELDGRCVQCRTPAAGIAVQVAAGADWRTVASMYPRRNAEPHA